MADRWISSVYTDAARRADSWRQRSLLRAKIVPASVRHATVVALNQPLLYRIVDILVKLLYDSFILVLRVALDWAVGSARGRRFQALRQRLAICLHACSASARGGRIDAYSREASRSARKGRSDPGNAAPAPCDKLALCGDSDVT